MTGQLAPAVLAALWQNRPVAVVSARFFSVAHPFTPTMPIP